MPLQGLNENFEKSLKTKDLNGDPSEVKAEKPLSEVSNALDGCRHADKRFVVEIGHGKKGECVPEAHHAQAGSSPDL